MLDLNEVPYVKTLLVIFCPVGFCFLLMIFSIAYKFYKKYEFLFVFQRFLVTAAITFFYFQPQVINALAGMLNCSQIENETYITDYPLEPCTSNARYSEWRNFLVLPTAFIFVIVLPAWPLYYMHQNKHIIFHRDVIYKVGFLLNGYAPHTFYWYIIFVLF